MCFHHPKPLKTTSIQNNPIKKGYKTHTCHGPITIWQRRCSYLWMNMSSFSLFKTNLYMKVHRKILRK